MTSHVFFFKPFIGGNAVEDEFLSLDQYLLIPVFSHRGKRLNNFTQLMKIDDPEINRSIEQSLEIDDLNINQLIDTIEKLLTE